MVSKALQIDVDAIVFDLEDSVPHAEKPLARSIVARALDTWPETHPEPYVRINAPNATTMEEDTRIVETRPAAGLVVPKIGDANDLASLRASLDLDSRDVIVTIETPRSLFHLEEIAEERQVNGLCLGGEDLAMSIGMQRTAHAGEFDIPRFLMTAAARSAGIAAYDAICPEFRDLDLVHRDAGRAARAGMDGKFAIHPAQVHPIRRAFAPDQADLDHARRVVSAYDDAVRSGRAAIAVDGQMIDPPVAERFRAMLQRWDTSEGDDE